MRVLKSFNNISDKLKEECIPDFGRDEFKTFKMLNGIANNDPDITERLKKPMFYPDAQIKTRDRIYDPYLNNNKGGYVDIGVVESFAITPEGAEVPTKFRCIVRGHGIGMFTLNGNSIEDRELFEFLCISNENPRFKYRDKSITPMFEEVLPTSKNGVEDNDELILKAGAKLKSLTNDEKQKVAILLQIDPSVPDLQNQLLQYAIGAPAQLLEQISHVKTTTGGKPIKRAAQADVLG